MGRNSLALIIVLALLAGPAGAAESVRKLILTHNYKRAASVLQSAAKAGNADAQYQLGVFYRSGLGVKRDEAKARFWLQKAAASGVAAATDVLRRISEQTTTDAERDGIAPKGGTAPMLPLLSIAHLPERQGILSPWLVEVTVRGLEKPVGLADVVNAKNVAGETPLLLAARLNKDEQIRSLLAQGANPALADMRGWTPVMWAAKNGNSEMIATLYDAGAKPGMKNLAGADPVVVAARACQMTVLPALAQGGESGNAATVAAGRCANWMQNFKPEPGLLQLSMKVGERADIESAIALDAASINVPDEQGFTSLHVAAARGDAKLVSALMNANASAEAVAKDGSTPLMLAAASGCLACVQRLLPYVQDINAKNVDGESALYLAVRARSIKVIQELRQAGASEASRTIGRDTPEKLATRLGDKKILAAVLE